MIQNFLGQGTTNLAYDRWLSCTANPAQVSFRGVEIRDDPYCYFAGILDQGTGVLVIFEETSEDKTYSSALDTIQNMGKVVDALYNKAKKLT